MQSQVSRVRSRLNRHLCDTTEPPKVQAISTLTTSEYVRGALYGIAAVSIWASWIVAVRLGITTSLKPWDITAIRFGVAGLILLPYLLKKGLAIDRLGWVGLAAIMVGGGAPIVLLSYGGLLFAPRLLVLPAPTAPWLSAMSVAPNRLRA